MNMSNGEKPRYIVRFRTARVQREIDSLTEREGERVRLAINELSLDPRPRGCSKLDDNTFRIRVGVWRVIYIIHDRDRIVDIAAVRRRSESTYRDIRKFSD
ncbi:MAG: type II toxin-antitoxin system RelE/ParE family toxin [SAR202 cluster bacterium]|nr:type II toxin-antitoxin system RelE/ParE family toxin [SAR202 cluster bacterium]